MSANTLSRSSSKDNNTVNNNIMSAVDSTNLVDAEQQHPTSISRGGDASGSSKIEAIQAIWGRHGKLIIVLALCVSMIAFEFDSSTSNTYSIYAQSNFDQLAASAAVNTAGGLCFAVLKPLVAKLSDVFGRGETYPVWVLFYVVAAIVCAKAANYESYATGYMIHIIAQTGVNTLNNILAADVSTARQRGFTISLQFLPYIFMPFTSAFITEKVVNGIGWRWGIGMIAIIMPVGLTPIIYFLLSWQRKSKKVGGTLENNITVYKFFSELDAGGLALFSGGLALILLPATLAGTLADGWRTGWVIACVVVGALCLITLPFYERSVAKHPFMPTRYLRDLNITMALLLYTMDGIASAVTYSYLYTWCIVARGYSIRNAVFITAINRAVQFLIGIVIGAILWWTRRYKWLTLVGVAVRFLSYGLMLRTRDSDSTTTEIIIVQVIQGIGDALVSTCSLVISTVAVPHKEMAQMTSLAVCLSAVGSTIAGAIAGGIYTNCFKTELLKELGPNGTSALIMSVFNSITESLPPVESPQRDAIARAYSRIMAYFTYVALGSISPGVIFAWYLPDRRLTDTHNLVEDQEPSLGEDGKIIVDSTIKLVSTSERRQCGNI
ncbi:MFS general substrate transporter [Jackrogersella minutella]|nr:MFS general substrate transporter [Jackrogersella minutella]